MRSSSMRALASGLAILASCSTFMPPATGGTPPTGCRATPPAIDLTIGIAFGIVMLAARHEIGQRTSESRDDEKKYATIIFGAPALGFLVSSALGFAEYAGCKRTVVPPPPRQR